MKTVNYILASVTIWHVLMVSPAMAQAEAQVSPGRLVLQEFLKGLGDRPVTPTHRQDAGRIVNGPGVQPGSTMPIDRPSHTQLQSAPIPGGGMALRDEQHYAPFRNATISGAVEIVPGVRADSTWSIGITTHLAGTQIFRCGSDGTFSANVPLGQWILQPIPPQSYGQCFSSTAACYPTEDQQPAVNIGAVVAYAPASVGGKIYGLSADELAQCVVHVRNGGYYSAATKPSLDGTYLLQGVAPGERTIVVETPADAGGRFPARTLRRKGLIRSGQVIAGFDIPITIQAASSVLQRR